MEGMLKVLAITLWPVLAVALFGSGGADDLSGIWTATMQRGNQTGNFVMNLQVDGNKLNGTLHDPSGQNLQIENAKVGDNQLSFDTVAQEHGHSKTIHFFGDVSGDAITLRNQSNGRQGQTITFHRSSE